MGTPSNSPKGRDAQRCRSTMGQPVPHRPPQSARLAFHRQELDRRRPRGSSAGRRPGGTVPGGTVRPRPPGVAQPGGNGRPNPEDLPAFGPLFSATRTGKSTVGRPARRSDRCHQLRPILTRCHRPSDDVRDDVGAPSAGPMSSTPTGMAPKWGREEIISVRPTRSQGARIAKKAAFALVGSRPTTRERILKWPAAAGPPRASPPRRRGKSAAETDTKGETAADHQRPHLKDASMSTNHPHRTLPAPPRTVSVQTLAQRRSHRSSRRPTLPGQRAPHALPPHLPQHGPTPQGAPCPQRHPRPPQTTSKNEIPHPHKPGGSGGSPPRADIARDLCKPPPGAQHDKADRVGIRGFEPRTSAA